MDHNMDKEKLNLYLSTLNEKNKNIVKTVIDNMMIEGTQNGIDKFHNKHQNYKFI